MNFSRDIVDHQDPHKLAIVERRSDGSRREWNFGEVTERVTNLAATFQKCGVHQGDVVMTLIGNRPEWVFSMLACFRLGAIALPCNEQLRSADITLRIITTNPKLIVVDPRNISQLQSANPVCTVLSTDDKKFYSTQSAAAVELDAEDPALITFTSGTSGKPKAAVHAQRYLFGQRLQAEQWLDVGPQDLVWCTAASGWSKSARNAFVAPWLYGATILLHDDRFDPHQRLTILAEEKVSLLCMAPTEYRIIAKHAELQAFQQLRGLVAAGEALNPEVLQSWQQATGLWIRDGYGQTETGQLTGTPLTKTPKPGSMGLPLPGIELWIDNNELVVNPASVPTFFTGYLGSAPVNHTACWRTGDRVRQDSDGYFFFEGRLDDVIISSGYRIGPFEVESALITHPAVAEAAVVAEPDKERGSVVRAVVVLRNHSVNINEVELKQELQQHVKATTAPYKYPRIIDFASSLPKTASGKILRVQLRRD